MLGNEAMVFHEHAKKAMKNGHNQRATLLVVIVVDVEDHASLLRVQS